MDGHDNNNINFPKRNQVTVYKENAVYNEIQRNCSKNSLDERRWPTRILRIFKLFTN